MARPWALPRCSWNVNENLSHLLTFCTTKARINQEKSQSFSFYEKWLSICYASPHTITAFRCSPVAQHLTLIRVIVLPPNHDHSNDYRVQPIAGSPALVCPQNTFIANDNMLLLSLLHIPVTVSRLTDNTLIITHRNDV